MADEEVRAGDELEGEEGVGVCQRPSSYVVVEVVEVENVDWLGHRGP